MTVLIPVTTLLNVLGTILDARGQDDLGEYAKLAASLINEGDSAITAMNDLANEIAMMVQEGRNPTTDEIQNVRNRRQSLSDAIQNSAGGTDPD